MSVVKSKRSKGELRVHIKAKELVTHTIKVTMNENVFPKRYRFTVTNKLVDTAVEMYSCLIEANEMYPDNDLSLQRRFYLQRRAGALCRVLSTLVDVAKETFNLPSNKVGYWAQLIFETRMLIVSWNKSDRERYQKK